MNKNSSHAVLSSVVLHFAVCVLDASRVVIVVCIYHSGPCPHTYIYFTQFLSLTYKEYFV